jgi:cytokinin riboside 5'-monophosphate phosphoribohydrolase
MNKSICVFSSSSEIVAPVYFQVATELGTLIAQKGFTLVFGGANVGLMGALAKSVHQSGGRVIGVIPQPMQGTPFVYEAADEIVVVETMRARKEAMENRADVFVSLPGGFGTLEEILEILTYKQLQFHTKPVILVNVNGFYNHLEAFFEHLFTERFASGEYHRQLYHFAPNVTSVFEHLDRYQSPTFPIKWF